MRRYPTLSGLQMPPYGILHTPGRQIPIIHCGHLRYAITRMRRLQQLGQGAWIETPRGTIR